MGARPDGFGTLADRVTSFCAEGDAICALTGKSKAIQAVVPLLNLRSQDIGPYVSGRAKTLLTNVASANPEDINRAVVSVINAARVAEPAQEGRTCGGDTVEVEPLSAP